LNRITTKSLVIIGFINVFSLKTQSQDTLVWLNELSFSTSREKDAFYKAIQEQQPDYFKLFNYDKLPETDYRKNKFYTFLKGLDIGDKGGKKNSKRVKYIYENVHTAFLTKYQAKNSFSEIFETGFYNCVSATALYCMAFEYFKIPYVIKEKPNHVYPVAYPQTDIVVVETTNPMVGSISFSEQFKRAYIENLRKQKLVSNHEVQSTDATSLFDQYFFGKESEVTLSQLVGIQYMNDGIFKFEEEDFSTSYKQWEKAYMFYKTDQVVNGLVLSYYKAFQSLTKKDSLHASLVAKLSRFTKFGVAQDHVKGEFGNAIQALLFENGNAEGLKNYYNVLQKGVRNKELKDELAFLYEYESGRYLFNQGRFSVSKPHFEKAFDLRPNNQDVQKIYLQVIAHGFRNATKGKEVLSVLKEALSRHSVLSNNNLFNSMLASSYLQLFGESFEDNKPNEGDEFRIAFEKIFTENNELTVEPAFIGQAYSQAAVYYFKRSQIQKAKSIIDKGLAIDPNNRELQARKRLIN
jgi:tetratricopeptide (TPR) repeat protein